MADQPDLEALARRYLDLWQDQLSALPDDPGLRDSLARLFGGTTAVPDPSEVAPAPLALWGLVPALMLAGFKVDGDGQSDGSTGHGNGGGPETDRAAGRRAAAADGAAAAGAASDHRDRRLDQLEARLGALEERIDRLAAGFEAGSGPAARKPGPGRS